MDCSGRKFAETVGRRKWASRNLSATAVNSVLEEVKSTAARMGWTVVGYRFMKFNIILV